MEPERIFPDEFVPSVEGASYYPKWVAANKNGDAPKWTAFRDAAKAYRKGDSLQVPAMATKYGRALVAAGKLHMSVTDIGSADWPSPPPPVGTGRLGLILNSGPTQAWLDKAATLTPKIIRDDSLYQSKVDWALAHGCDIIGLLLVNQTGVNTAMQTVNAWPQITKWELDNEPYFVGYSGGFRITTWAQLCLQLAQTIKAQHPTYEVILPMLVQANGGDYEEPLGTWAPWATRVLNAAPGLMTYCDTVAGHPYTNGGGIAQPPSFSVATVDKVRGQISSQGWTPDWHMTEFGWTVGTGAYQVNAATQSTYLNDMVTLLRARSWVRSMEVYCLQTWGTGYEESFGVFDQNLGERPAAATFRSLV